MAEFQGRPCVASQRLVIVKPHRFAVLCKGHAWQFVVSSPERRQAVPREGALLHPAGRRRGPGDVPGARQRAGHRRPHQRRAGRDYRTPAVDRGDPRAATSATRPSGRQRTAPARLWTAAEQAFLSLSEGAVRWLIEAAAAAGAQRVWSEMARAVELAAITGSAQVDQGLGLAAIARRFGHDDLPTILDHLSVAGTAGELVTADEAHSAQPGTGWATFGGTDAAVTSGRPDRAAGPGRAGDADAAEHPAGLL
jgi:hypothetical protein